MKVATSANPLSPTMGSNVNKPVVAKRAFSVKSKMGHNRNSEYQRTLVHSTMTNASVANNSSNMTTFAMSSRSSLTKRITQSSLNGQVNCNNTTSIAVPSDPTSEPNPLLPKATLVQDNHDQSSSSTPSSNSGAHTLRSVWYLGGNQLANLLSSVDGDLDPILLATIAEVPSAVGDLALSVESLVSDDLFTVGGFETELLAQIASNTLAAKQQHQTIAAQQPFSQTLPSPPQAAKTYTTPPILSPKTKKEFHTLTLDKPLPPSATSSDDVDTSATATTETALASTFVPNPLAHYDPVPNPLARITPPASPLPTSVSTSAATTPISTTSGR